MYLEIKAIFSSIGIICAGIVMGFLLFSNILLTVILLVSIIFFIIGDLFLGFKIVRYDLKPQLDPTPPGQETCILFDLTKNFRIINTFKKPHGKREFRYNNQDASVINKGNYQVRLPNGNGAFIAHESYDENIDLFEAKYAEKLKKKTGTSNLKEIYAMAVNEDEQ